MTRPLGFLLYRSMVGRISTRLRLIKQPKYLLGILITVGWCLFLFMQIDPFGSGDMDNHVQVGMSGMLEEEWTSYAPLIHLVISLFLLVMVSLWWLVPLGKGTVELREAELNLLLPAPVARRHIIQYSLWKAQPGVLFGVIMMTVFMSPESGLGRVWAFLSFWVIMTLWYLHSKARGLWLARMRERPVVGFQVYVVTAAAILGVLLWMALAVNPILARLIATAPENWGSYLVREFGDEPLQRLGWSGLLLLPFYWITAPLFAGIGSQDRDITGRGVALVFPLLLLLLHNEWVVRSQARFEEASLEEAKNREKAERSGVRFWKMSERKRKMAPFTLRSLHPPATAVLWKNLLVVGRISYGLFLLLSVAVAVLLMLVFLFMPVIESVPAIIGVLSLAALVFFPVFGSRIWRNDLRIDLQHLEMVRTWPLRFWHLVSAEVLSPVVAAIPALLLAAAALFGMHLGSWLRYQLTGVLAIPFWGPEQASWLNLSYGISIPILVVALLPILLAVSALSSAIQNLMTLAFPGWTDLGLDKQQGAAKFGHNLILGAVLMISLAVGLLPGALLVSAILFFQFQFTAVAWTSWELPFLSLCLATPTVVMAGALIFLASLFWKHLDPSVELLHSA